MKILRSDIDSTIEALSKLKVRATKSKNIDIINWCNLELNGYPLEMKPPLYRQINSDDWRLEMSGRDEHGHLLINTFTITMLRNAVNGLPVTSKDIGIVAIDNISKRVLQLRIGLHKFTGYDDLMLAIDDDKVLNELASTSLVHMHGSTAPATLAQFIIHDKLKIFSRILKIINEDISYKMAIIDQELIDMQEEKNRLEKETFIPPQQSINIIGNKNKVSSNNSTINNTNNKYTFKIVLSISIFIGVGVTIIYKFFL